MPSANELLQEFALRHAIFLQGVSNAESKSMLSLLEKLEREIAGRIMMESGSALTKARLKTMLKDLRGLIGPVYQQIIDRMEYNLYDLTKKEINVHSQALYQSVAGGTPLSVAVYSPAPEQVYSASLKLAADATMNAAFAKVAVEAGRAVTDRIAAGYLIGETNATIVRNVLSDLNKPRRQVETIVRTAIGHYSATARNKVFEANSHIVKALQWSSTLDGRTTLQYCIPRSGKLYTLKDHKPIRHALPWMSGPGMIHWNCRSSSVAITKDLNGMMLDRADVPPEVRPYVAFQAPIGKDGKPIQFSKHPSKMSVGEYTRELKKNGYSMDEIKQIRSRMIGTVPAQLSYGAWLKQQAKTTGGREFVTEVLGPTRAKLFLDGKLSIEQFSNNKGFLIRLSDLEKRHAAAWARAGLNPEIRN